MYIDSTSLAYYSLHKVNIVHECVCINHEYILTHSLCSDSKEAWPTLKQVCSFDDVLSMCIHPFFVRFCAKVASDMTGKDVAIKIHIFPLP